MSEKNTKSTKKWIIIPEIVIVVLLFMISIFTIASTSKEGIARDPIFGISLLPVRSNSMQPVFEEKDLLIAKKIKDMNDLKVGDIISFKDIDNGVRFINTHEIVRIEEDGTIYTQGRNREMSKVAKVTNRSDILAIYKSHINNIGGFFLFFEDRINYTVFILVPLMLLFIWNLYGFIKMVLSEKRKKAIDKAVNSGELTDELKEIAIKEFLAKQAELAKKDENSDVVKETES